MGPEWGTGFGATWESHIFSRDALRTRLATGTGT
jgi:hypothetical protein